MLLHLLDGRLESLGGARQALAVDARRVRNPLALREHGTIISPLGYTLTISAGVESSVKYIKYTEHVLLSFPFLTPSLRPTPLTATELNRKLRKSFLYCSFVIHFNPIVFIYCTLGRLSERLL